MPSIDVYRYDGYMCNFIKDDIFNEINENEWYYVENWFINDIVDNDRLDTDLNFICFKLSERGNSVKYDYLNFSYGKLIVKQEKTEYGSISLSYSNGKLYGREFRNHFDYFHNEKGPAAIYYEEDGVISGECYRLNGISLSKEEWEEQMLTKLYW